MPHFELFITPYSSCISSYFSVQPLGGPMTPYTPPPFWGIAGITGANGVAGINGS